MHIDIVSPLHPAFNPCSGDLCHHCHGWRPRLARWNVAEQSRRRARVQHLRSPTRKCRTSRVGRLPTRQATHPAQQPSMAAMVHCWVCVFKGWLVCNEKLVHGLKAWFVMFWSMTGGGSDTWCVGQVYLYGGWSSNARRAYWMWRSHVVEWTITVHSNHHRITVDDSLSISKTTEAPNEPKATSMQKERLMALSMQLNPVYPLQAAGYACGTRWSAATPLATS